MEKSYSLKSLIFFSLLLAICTLGGEVYAAIIQVPGQHATITAALSAATPGTTVRVAEGTYFEHVTLKQGVILEGGWNKDFSRRDVASFVVVIDGAKEKGPVVTGADQATLDGFTIIHASLLETDESSAGSGIYCTGSSPTIKNNIVRDNEPSGIFCDNSSAVIVNNQISGNAQAGVYMQKGSSLKISGNTIWGNNYSGIGCGKKPVSQFEITQNVIHSNKRSGINVKSATGTIRNNLIYDNQRAGIRCHPMPVVIINNTVVGSGWTGVLIEDPAAVPSVKNNIITHNIDAGILAVGEGYDHNLFFANGETGDCDPNFLWCVKPQFGGYGDETSYLKKKNLISDPLFVDLAGHDYHLQAGSPAIDAGDRKSEFNDVNFPASLGTPRNDMGVYGGPFAQAEERTKDNVRPQAVVGDDLEVFAGRRVVLDGKESLDPDGDAITYLWTLVRKPDGSKAKLSRPGKMKTAFKADVPGLYGARLVVTDTQGESSEPQIVKITVPENRPPVASIGEMITQISAEDTITMYGSASRDPEKAQLTYLWSFLFKPEKSRATLSTADGNCSFLVDVDGSYTVQLIVNDGELDSPPVTVNVSTRNSVTAGIRRVPEEYPTIQSALDAAQPGDDIIVQKGRYEELLVIDKSVNLIGKDWPVIDGGRQNGNKNTISIFYLGDRAGRVEGFVITGGGRGGLGHGINIWDSAPDIFNNKVIGNNHGMGIHGSPTLTSKTKVHGNLVSGNLVGIGNGKDSSAHIYNNRVYNNSVVGIGCRGKATTRIEANYIYGNHIGIGAREVASPTIEGNRIFDNTDGIVISPLSTIKKFAFNDILIKNNLIVNNDHLGVNITSFNLSKVIIANNTIDSNNKGKRKLRGGGLILGYPQPATYTAVVENNIISNNQVVGMVKYIGPDNFQKPGAILSNDRNNLWNNTVNYLDCQAGSHALSQDPKFVGLDAGGLDPYLNKPVAEGSAGIGYQLQAYDFSELPLED